MTPNNKPGLWDRIEQFVDRNIGKILLVSTIFFIGYLAWIIQILEDIHG